ncbi:hypothetical protein CI238_10308 [Colletotrichum incanum]|uniref:Uncharacterized protein n=1 Tax=Colletotrichum incanum TaxID=1573173 RepID=A0A167DGX4_COLIC|nr:hypothetical protein CI238_10308 [Colletotrichum incanum]
MSAPTPAPGRPCVTARVIKEWTADDAARLQKQKFLSGHLPRGVQGYLPRPDRLIKNRYHIFQPLVEDDKGWHWLYPNTALSNAIFVPKEYIEIGQPQLPTPRIVGLDKPFNVVKAKKNTNNPLAHFITTFLETCVEARESLELSGVSGEQLGVLTREHGVLHIVTQIIDGMETAKTFDMFRNGMPSLKDLISKGKRLKDFAQSDKQKLDNMLALYAIVYFCEDSTFPDGIKGHVYGGRTIRGWECFKQHDANIRSNSPISNYSHFWSSTVAQKIYGIVQQLTRSSNPQRPAECPNFGPGAIRSYLHGLNWSSPVMEMFYDEAGLWTRILIKDNKGKPLLWQFIGPPRRVRDDLWEQRDRTADAATPGGHGSLADDADANAIAQATTAFSDLTLKSRRAMPDPHPNQKVPYTRSFRSCNIISDRSGKDEECCKSQIVPGFNPIKDEMSRTCPFCGRLRRFCTFTIDNVLWANCEGDNKHWRGLTIFEPIGQLWKQPVLIGKFKGVEQVVYDGAAFDADDEMEEDVEQQWSAFGRKKSTKNTDDGAEEIDSTDIKFLDA